MCIRDSNATCRSMCRQSVSKVSWNSDKNKKVLGPNRVNMNGLLETGSGTTGNWQRLSPMALLITFEITWYYLDASKRYFKTLDQSLSRKKKKNNNKKKQNNNRSFRPSRKALIIIKKQNNNRSFRRSRKALIISKFFIHNFFIVHIL